MGDAPDSRTPRRVRWAAALLVLGLLVAFVPALAAGHEFLADQHVKFEFSPGGSWYSDRDFYLLMRGDLPPSLLELVRFERTWAVAMFTLLAAPLAFLWWRMSDAVFGRAIGASGCVVATIVVTALAVTHPYFDNENRGWTWCSVPLGGALMAVAFLLAPAPRVRDE